MQWTRDFPVLFRGQSIRYRAPERAVCRLRSDQRLVLMKLTPPWIRRGVTLAVQETHSRLNKNSVTPGFRTRLLWNSHFGPTYASPVTAESLHTERRSAFA